MNTIDTDESEEEQTEVRANLRATHPEPIVVPLDYIGTNMAKPGEGIAISEGSMYVMSKAVERFAKTLMRQIAANGTVDLSYDEMAAFVQNSEYELLRPFFPFQMTLAEFLRHRDDQSNL